MTKSAPSGSPTASGDRVVSPFGWWRAAGVALAVLVVGAGLFAYGPNWILLHLTGLSRSGRVAVATTAFFVLLAGAAWLLRRLQGRGVV